MAARLRPELAAAKRPQALLQCTCHPLALARTSALRVTLLGGAAVCANATSYPILVLVQSAAGEYGDEKRGQFAFDLKGQQGRSGPLADTQVSKAPPNPLPELGRPNQTPYSVLRHPPVRRQAHVLPAPPVSRAALTRTAAPHTSWTHP
jgi:hypothetical protein